MKTSVVLLTTLVTLTFVDLALARRNRGGNRNNGRNDEGEKCQYDRASARWTQCDPATNKITKTITLKPDQPESCTASKILEKPCNKLCKYERVEWSECDVSTNLRSRTMTLKSTSPDTCAQSVTRTQPCKNKKARKGRKNQQLKARGSRNQHKTYKCKFVTSSWSECDDVTEMKVVTLTLRKGDPVVCGETKFLNESCAAIEEQDGCKYDQQVGDCLDGKRIITQTLREGPESCQRTTTKDRVCGPGARNKNKKARKERRKARRQERRNNANNDDEA